MSSPKPSETKQWAVVDTETTGSPVVEPDGAFKVAGFQPGEKVFAQFLNWAFNLDTAWDEYLNDFEEWAHTWLELNTFAKGVDLGTALVGSAANAVVERLKIRAWEGDDTVDAKTLVWKSDLYVSQDFRAACWVSQKGYIELTINATWDNTAKKWSKTEAGVAAGLLRLSLSGLVIGFKAAAEDTAWDQSLSASTGWTTVTNWTNTVATFGRNLVVGTELLGSFANAVLARGTFSRATNATSARTLIFHYATSEGAGQHIRLYRSNFEDEAWELAFNCFYSATGAPGTWTHDAGNSEKATLIQITRNKFHVNQTTSTTTWNDNGSGWDLGFPLYALRYGVNYSGSDAFRNTLTHANMAKVICKLNFDGSGGSPTIDTAARFNVASAAFTGAGTDICRVTFAQAFAVSGGFVPQIQIGVETQKVVAGGSALVIWPKVVAWTANTVDFRLDGKASGTDIQTAYFNSGTSMQNFVGSIGIACYGAQ